MLRIARTTSMMRRTRAGAAVSDALLLGVLFVIAVMASPAGGLAKQPGAVHCYGGRCHRVNTLEEMDSIVGRRGVLKASYYDDCRRDRFNTCGLTSSGAVFEPDRPDNAASPIFPDGSVLLVFNPGTGKAAVVRVNSAGPYHSDRTLDVSRATAEALGFKTKGVAELTVAVLKSPDAEEARYRKLRAYAEVPGFIGTFLSFEAAHAEAAKRLQLLPQPTQLASIPLAGEMTRPNVAIADVVAMTPAAARIGATAGRGPLLRARGSSPDVVNTSATVNPGLPGTMVVASDVRTGFFARLEDLILAARGSAQLRHRPAAVRSHAETARFAERFWQFVAEARLSARPAPDGAADGSYRMAASPD